MVCLLFIASIYRSSVHPAKAVSAGHGGAKWIGIAGTSPAMTARMGLVTTTIFKLTLFSLVLEA
jgi:hypothetical protein